MPNGDVHPLLVWSALAYVLVIAAVAWWAARRTRDARDFFIAGQRIGLVVTAFATMSAAFSGFVFVGGPGLTYRVGLASLFIVLPVGFTAGMLCWVLAKRLRLLAGAREIYTIPDVIQCRFGSRRATGLAAGAVLLGCVGYLGAQLLALGVLVETFFDLEPLLGSWSLAGAMALGSLVVLAYAAAGGMVAGVYTDLVQGVLMVAAALAVFWHALRVGGGLPEMATRIAASEHFGPGFLDPLGGLPVLTVVGFFFVFGVGTLGQPQMLHKFFMLDDPRKLKWMPLVLGLSQTMCLLIWLGIGLAVPALVAGGQLAPLAEADQAAPLFLLRFTPPILAGLVVAGILAAIMSTADSLLNIAAAALVRDLPRVLGRPLADELRWGRLAVVAVALAACCFAFLYGDLIALLGTFAFGTFAAALAPALAVGLNWRRVGAGAATASMATGLALNLGLELLHRQHRLDWLPAGALPSAVALAASFSVLLLLSWLRPEPPEGALGDDIELVMQI